MNKLEKIINHTYKYCLRVMEDTASMFVDFT